MDAPRQREGEADGRGLTVWTHFSVPPPPLSFRLQSPSLLPPHGVAAAAAAVDTWATPQGSSDPFILAFDGEYCFSKPIPAAGRRTDDGIASQSVRQAGVGSAAARGTDDDVVAPFLSPLRSRRRFFEHLGGERGREGDHKISPSEKETR